MNRTVSFYNHISAEYDATLANVASNQEVRHKIANTFNSFPSTYLLDFGGGTGLDLPWLVGRGQLVYFCEPAEKMRAVARQTNGFEDDVHRVRFLNNEETDFSHWLAGGHPFAHPIDTVLANFAVINCIEDIGRLFEALALITRPGAHVILNVIDTRLPKLLRKYPRNWLKAVIAGQKVVRTTTRLHQHSHEVYLHTPAQIKSKSAHYFTFESSEPIGGYGFLMLHLIRK